MKRRPKFHFFRFTSFYIICVASVISSCGFHKTHLTPPELIDQIPPIKTGFYTVHKNVDGVINEEAGSSLLGRMIYIYKDQFIEGDDFFTGVSGSFLPNYRITTIMENGKIKFLWQDIGARFVIATAIDCEQYFEILYHYSDDESGCVINLKCFIRDHENPQVESITPMIPGAEWIEREMHDLEGIDFKNHPCLERLILADDWPEEVHPLRKDWNNEKEN